MLNDKDIYILFIYNSWMCGTEYKVVTRIIIITHYTFNMYIEIWSSIGIIVIEDVLVMLLTMTSSYHISLYCFDIWSAINVIMIDDEPGWYWPWPVHIAHTHISTLLRNMILNQWNHDLLLVNINHVDLQSAKCISKCVYLYLTCNGDNDPQLVVNLYFAFIDLHDLPLV